MLVEEKRRLLELLQLFDERIIGIETGVQYGRPVTLIEMEDFVLEECNDKIVLDLAVKTVPVYVYVFPNNEETGNLENLLLEAAEEAYPELLSLACDYVEKASEYQKSGFHIR